MGSVGLSVEPADQIMVGPTVIPLPRIRAGRRTDLDALLALDQRIFGADAASRRSIKHALDSAHQVVLVAEMADELAGSATVHFHFTTARLYSIAVVPEYRRRKVGLFLLSMAEREARYRACTNMRLEVRDDNDSAIAFYRDAAYVAFSRRIGYYKDGTDALRFVKVI